jgi:hypothetical protein
MKDSIGQNTSCVLPDLVFPMKTHRVFIPCKPAASTRGTLRQTFSTFSNTWAGLMGQTYWDKHPRDQSANIKSSGCAVLWTHHHMAAPRPPATVHPRQNQYMWTLKMHTPGIHLQERGKTSATQDVRFCALLYVFFEVLLPRTAPENHRPV